MDVLVWCKRHLQPIVNCMGINKLVSPIYQRILKWRYQNDGLAVADQNGRVWKLHHEVALRGKFQEYETVKWLREVVHPGACVFDIGANVGQMTLESAILAGPKGKVIAIEPAPGNFKLLTTHLNANQLADRVQLIQAACGREDRDNIDFQIIGDSPEVVGSGHSIRKSNQESSGKLTIPVRLVSVDGLCNELQLTPTVIKIDVEGAELDVIHGALATLKKYQPEVLMAFHPFAFDDSQKATEEIIKLFQSCGYATPTANEKGQFELAEYRMKPKKS